MKTPAHTNTRSTRVQPAPALLAIIILFIFLCTLRAHADPRTNSWFTTYSGVYARIYTNNVCKTNGLSATMWTNTAGGTVQTLPVYCGVQEIYSSSNWVYIRSSGLPSHIMGPWYLNAAQTQLFPNYPTNEHVLYRIPRIPSVPADKTRNDGGAIGYFVDGAAMFNSWDAYTYTNGADSQGGGDGGYWNRDAYVNEGVSFDPNNAHQAGGQHHYHANPPALRYQLGDHVDFNSITKAYTEDTGTPTKHSPILAWTSDGFPVYGPYGYSVSNNASSSIRRMVSGYVLRNGQNGSQNLTSVGRTDLPQWAARLYDCSTNVYAGPAVSTSYPLGRYMEDNDYLGDLGYKQGVTNADGTYYDLDEYNGRWCVTPDFPGGTYAYFVSVSATGTPTFPYNIGRGYYGSPTGSVVSAISESVTTNFIGGPNSIPALNSPAVKNGTVTLTWSATEGGTYMVQSTTNFSSWTTNSTTATAVLNTASYTNQPADKYRFYRTALTALASYDSAGSGGYVPTFAASAPGGSATRGEVILLTVTLPGNPPSPPANAPISSVLFSNASGVITGYSLGYTTSGTATATFSLTNVPSGTQTENVLVGFTSGPSIWLNSDFTIY